jgi:hypothetical protein
MSDQLPALAALQPGLESPICNGRWLRGPQSRSGHSGGEEKNSHHCPCQESNPGRPARSLVSVLTVLHWTQAPHERGQYFSRRGGGFHPYIR